MDISIVARHMDLTPALTDYINKKIQRVNKYYNAINNAHVVLTSEKHRQTAHVTLHAVGMVFRAKEISGDMYAAVDLVSDKLDQQVKKHKEKLKLHHGGDGPSMRTLPLSPSFQPQQEKIIKRDSLIAKPLTIDDAIASLDASRKKMLVFVDTDTNRYQLLLKKDKGFQLTEIVSA